MKRYAICLLFLALLTVQGCLLMSAGLLITAAVIDSSEKKTKTEMQTKYRQEYNSYRIEMEKLSLEREKQKMKPQEVLSFEAWVDTLALPPKDREILVGLPPKAKEEPKKEAAEVNGVAGVAPDSSTGNQ